MGKIPDITNARDTKTRLKETRTYIYYVYTKGADIYDNYNSKMGK